jgi:hypothetical protein
MTIFLLKNRNRIVFSALFALFGMAAASYASEIRSMNPLDSRPPLRPESDAVVDGCLSRWSPEDACYQGCVAQNESQDCQKKEKDKEKEKEESTEKPAG